MSKQGYYITSKGDRVELEYTEDVLDIPFMDIVELIIPEGVNTVFCDNNKLTELILPEGIKTVYCYNNNISNLILPKAIEGLYCWQNQITNLVLPKGIKHVCCDINALDDISKYERLGTDIRLYG